MQSWPAWVGFPLTPQVLYLCCKTRSGIRAKKVLLSSLGSLPIALSQSPGKAALIAWYFVLQLDVFSNSPNFGWESMQNLALTSLLHCHCSLFSEWGLTLSCPGTVLHYTPSLSQCECLVKCSPWCHWPLSAARQLIEFSASVKKRSGLDFSAPALKQAI